MAAAPPIRLETELGLYEARKSEWLKTKQDQFVVIKGTEIVGFYATFHHAYRAGVENYGVDADFLVKRVVLQEPVFVVF